MTLGRIAGFRTLRAAFSDAIPYGSGHINDTYGKPDFQTDDGVVSTFTSGFNHNVFKEPES